jgi:threonine synthase
MKLICQSCHREYNSSDLVWHCHCGGLLRLQFQARFPIEKIQKRKPTLWRYREAIPIDQKQNIISFDEGFTPLVTEQFFGKKILLKQDYLFPTGSFKDRGASVLMSKIKELGITTVVEDSSGNAGAAIAGYCAKANIRCHIYVPEKTSAEKLLQIKQYGAFLHKIGGTRELTAEAALKHAQKIYYASHYWNPYFFQGTKTFIFEVVEQLGWRRPDVLFLPVGNGTLLLGCFIGLQELQQEDVIDTLPKIIGVQAGNCAPLAYSWNTHSDIGSYPVVKSTIAEGIAIRNPIRAYDILDAVKKTKGTFITVTEREISAALSYSMHKGYYIEPTSAVAIAGFKKYPLKKDDDVVVPLTGHGLKVKNH